MSVQAGDGGPTHNRTNSATGAYSAKMPVEIQRHLSDIISNNNSPVKMRKAKRIRFLCNGDRFNKGVVMAVAPERYRSFDSLLNDLTRAFSGNRNLPSGVRTLFTMDGSKVSHLNDLEDGKFYVCSGFGEQFKRVNYIVMPNQVRPTSMLPKIPNNSTSAYSSLNPNINNNHINGNSNSNSNNMNNSVSSTSSSGKLSVCLFRPKILIIVRNGNRPRRVLRLLLNKRNSPSFDHALSTITDAVKLDTGAVRKIYNSKGGQLTQLEDFFREEDVFFAYGSERVSQEDFELDFEELKAIQSQKKGLRRPVTELKNGTHCMDETGKRVPKLPNTKTRRSGGMKGVVKSESAATINVPNNLLNKYSIGKVIGEGNFAIVRRCVDKLKQLEYALKIIDKSKVAGKEQMIQNEVSILRSIEHPNIIQLFGEHETPSELYLMMELVRGGDLFDAISKQTCFSEYDSQVITHDLTSALAYLHERNIVHRDVKPENLLVEMEGDHVHLLKLGDFGLAQLVTEPLFTVCGTPTYVAPEILTEHGYGLKIDVWAAGVILYILLCGFPPFVSSNNNQEELFDDILSGQYGFPSPYWDHVSDCAKDLISSMLQSNPDERFSAEDVLDHAWLEPE